MNPLFDNLNLSLSSSELKLSPRQAPSTPQEVEIAEDELFKLVLTHLDASWWINGDYPSPSSLCNRFGITFKQLSNLQARLNPPLKVRGLPPVEFLPATRRRVLDDEYPELFVAAVSLVADTLDKRALSKKLETLGVTTRQWKAWLKVPKYLTYYQLHVNNALNGALDSAKLSLTKNVEAGDLQSIKYLNELTGVYRPNQQTLLNLGVLIGRLMEILPKYLDQNQMISVADEFEQVLAIETTSSEALQ